MLIIRPLFYTQILSRKESLPLMFHSSCRKLGAALCISFAATLAIKICYFYSPTTTWYFPWTQYPVLLFPLIYCIYLHLYFGLILVDNLLLFAVATATLSFIPQATHFFSFHFHLSKLTTSPKPQSNHFTMFFFPLWLMPWFNEQSSHSRY